jgi:membrane-bound lytic murein transglycosylase B
MVLMVAGLGVAAERPFDPRWERLQQRLVADGIDHAEVRAAFGDPRMEAFRGLAFSLYPREHSSLYRGFLRADSVGRARRCRAEHDRAFRAAEQRFGVSAGVVSAILHVETQCGANTGRRRVLAQLAKLAMSNDPANVRWNIARHTKGVPAHRRAGVEARVRTRARELEAMFYPEVLATFRVAERNRVEPMAMTGSGAGAFGLPQFLPSSYLRFAVDGNGDGRISLFDPDDAIASAANYLRGNGWRPGIRYADQRRVIWSYNHSDAYIDTVLTLAGKLE